MESNETSAFRTPDFDVMATCMPNPSKAATTVLWHPSEAAQMSQDLYAKGLWNVRNLLFTNITYSEVNALTFLGQTHLLFYG